MADDPKKKRLEGAPAHPSGFPVADDGPAHVAPAIDVRPRARTRNPLPEAEPDEEDTGVPFLLAFPVEERVSDRVPLDLDAEKTLDEAAPLTVDFERNMPTLHHVRVLPLDGADEVTLHPVPAPMARIGAGKLNLGRSPAAGLDGDSDDDDQMAQRDALILDIAAMGPLDERGDRSHVRTVAARATLARARALRFRLSLLDVWPAGQTPRATTVEVQARPLHIDLSLDCALLTALADGAPTPGQTSARASLFPFVGPLAAILLAYRPDLPRTAFRDRGAATIARLTIFGWRTACEVVTRSARSVPIESRRLALEIAARVAYVPPMNSERLGALNDLEIALGLETGSAALAIDLARRS
jgi:hypothetical protein